MLGIRVAVAVLASSLMLAFGAPSASAATFVVTRGDDPSPDGCAPADCSLREAVIAANGTAANDDITLPAGSHVLSIAGMDDTAAAGDLDIVTSATGGTLAINGAGAGSTTVDANDIDRVFHVLDGGAASFSEITIQDGSSAGITNDDNIGTPDPTTLTVSNSVLTSNSGDRAIDNQGAGNATISGSTISGNDTGGIVNESAATMAIAGSTISGNAIGLGAGILNQNQATMTIADTTISGNDGSLGGGILNQNQATMTISRAAIVDNDVDGLGGGGIANQNQALLDIDTSTISGNSVVNGLGGGGIFNQNQGEVTMFDSTVSGNTVTDGDGGALFEQNQAVFSATNTTISGNSATGRGGAAIGGNQPRIELRNSTVAGNSAGVAGGGFFDNTSPGTPPFFIFAGTIVAENTAAGAPSNCVNTHVPTVFASEGYNLEDASTCGFGATGDIVNGAPALGLLANNGGPTETRALGPGSAAIDAGSPGCPPPAVDQRGIARPQGAACDIGAFERVPTPPPPSPYEERCGAITIDGVTLQGTAAKDKLTGTARSDLLRGAGGKDRIKGAEDDDCLFGNSDADRVRGNAGDDLIRAGSGNDRISGGKGDDNIRAQDGNDKVKGGSGDDFLKAQGRGSDKVNCGSGKDRAKVDVKDKVSKNCEKVTVVDPR